MLRLAKLVHAAAPRARAVPPRHHFRASSPYAPTRAVARPMASSSPPPPPQQPLDAVLYDRVMRHARAFFADRLGYIEVPTQSRLGILSACEDPHNIAAFEYHNSVWPLPQTGQMALEYELLTRSAAVHDRARLPPGYFCVTTSYRLEPDAVPGRHDRVFPMLEFESYGGMTELAALLRDFCRHMGLAQRDIYAHDYDAVVEKVYGNNAGGAEVDHAAEEALYLQFGEAASFVGMFPETSTHPFFNMARTPDGAHAYKIDVIMGGQETIGAAERSCDVAQMCESFRTIEHGRFAERLYALFGKQRVEAELDEFLSLPMCPRFGGGIGMTRLARAMVRMQRDGFCSLPPAYTAPRHQREQAQRNATRAHRALYHDRVASDLHRAAHEATKRAERVRKRVVDATQQQRERVVGATA